VQGRNPCVGQGFAPSIGYNFSLVAKDSSAMEAERLNQIAASLADLRTRTDELRRYL